MTQDKILDLGVVFENKSNSNLQDVAGTFKQEISRVLFDEQELTKLSEQIDELKNREKELSNKTKELERRYQEIKEKYSENNAPFQRELKNIDVEFQKEFLLGKYPTIAYVMGIGVEDEQKYREHIEVNHVEIREKLAEEFSSIQCLSLKYFLLKKSYNRCSYLFNPHSNPSYCRIYDRNSVEKLWNAIDPATKVESIRTGTGHYYGSYPHLTSFRYIEYPDDVIYDVLGIEQGERGDFLIILPTLDKDLQQSQNESKLRNNVFEVFKQAAEAFPEYQKECYGIGEGWVETEKMLEDIKKEKGRLEHEKNDLEDELNFIRPLSPENGRIVRELKGRGADISHLKHLFKIGSDLDLLVFNTEEGLDFLKKCTQSRIRPCLDGKNFIGIKIEEAPSINTGAGLQYGKNVSIWYQGEIYGTRYYKYRDGYSASGDDPSNCFNQVNDIIVNRETGYVAVVVGSNEGSKTLYFDANFLKSLESGKKGENQATREQIENAKTNFTKKSEELLKLHTRNMKAPLHYNMKYRGNISTNMDPLREVPYEEAKIIDKAFDDSLLTGVMVLSAQIDANASSGRQMEYVAYVIDPEGNSKQCWRDCIYADALHAGKLVNIPQVNTILDALRNGCTIEDMSSYYEKLAEKSKKLSKKKSNHKARSSGFRYVDRKIVSEEDAYSVFGLPIDTPFAVVKRMYRKFSQKLHPDKNPNNPDATRNFQKLGEAYEFLDKKTA